MTKIHRDIEAAESEQFDLVIVGGGIYGTCMLLEAARRGWKTLLLERDDFGGATSHNSLRILHGGLRYLQHLDLARFRRSVREQAWWLSNFPDLVEPLPCVMPLYNKGLHRTAILRWALKLNDVLAKPIRSGTPALSLLSDSKILNMDQTLSRFPLARQTGLKGGAYWFDVRMKSPPRLLVELLRWSIAAGGRALNYAECTGFDQKGGKIEAVHTRCRATKKMLRIATHYVVNCAGPWGGDVENQLEAGGQVSPKSIDHAVAFNLILRRKPLSSCAVAVTADRKDAQTFFVVPHADRMLVGTQHLPPQSGEGPSGEQISNLLNELNLAIPGMDFCPDDVDAVLVGRLPASAAGSHLPAKSARVMQLEASHGIKNMISVEGPKYTTARNIAETTFRKISQQRGLKLEPYSQVARPPTVDWPDLSHADLASASLAQDLHRWVEHESILQIDDLLLRRCDLIGQVEKPLKEWLATQQVWTRVD